MGIAATSVGTTVPDTSGGVVAAGVYVEAWRHVHHVVPQPSAVPESVGIGVIKVQNIG